MEHFHRTNRTESDEARCAALRAYMDGRHYTDLRTRGVVMAHLAGHMTQAQYGRCFGG